MRTTSIIEILHGGRQAIEKTQFNAEACFNRSRGVKYFGAILGTGRAIRRVIGLNRSATEPVDQNFASFLVHWGF